jgi:hypothetical protein
MNPHEFLRAGRALRVEHGLVAGVELVPRSHGDVRKDTKQWIVGSGWWIDANQYTPEDCRHENAFA